MLRRFIVPFLTLFILMPVFPSYGAGQPSLNTEKFAQIPVLHNGRVKPMESFAKAIVKPLTGSDTMAVDTLIKMLFNPAKTEQENLIKISHPDTIGFLNLPKRKQKRYSYLEVANALLSRQDMVQSILSAPPTQLTAAQKELTHLYDQTLIMRDVMGSLILFMPLRPIDWNAIPANLKPADMTEPTLADFLPLKNKIHARAQTIAKAKGTDLANYTASEQAIATLSFHLIKLEEPLLYSQLLKVVYVDGKWQSPWDYIRNDKEIRISPTLELLRNATQAYYQGDWKTWNSITDHLTYQAPPSMRLSVETLYNQIQPFFLSMLFYCMALMFLGVQGFQNKRHLIQPAFYAGVAGLGLHLIGLAMRVYILQRPPVSTLYESILFVSAIGVSYALFSFYRHKKNTTALTIGVGFGVVLYMLAYFNDQSGDTMLMLSAVLNTNFWLATHVLCITAGYAFCLITSGFAHYELIEKAIFSKSKNNLLNQNIQKSALYSLLLCTLGTILGGVWADQSWGRFWGWDPKENGALLIVIWLIWLLHGKISKQITPTLFTAGLAYLSVIVSLSWFGVNLLSIGLHAYGFSDAALWWLGGFIVFETALIGVLVIKDRQNHAR